MSWQPIDTWIVLTGALIAMSCALPGSFLILNRNSMMGDGISHAILPGIAIAFLLTGSRDWYAMLIGAAVAGILTAILSRIIERFGQVESGAALGVVFCSLFAMGLILIRIASDKVHLDPNCVLYGTIETAVVDFRIVPYVTLQAAVTLALNLILIFLFYKELRLSAFDPSLASALGFRPEFMRYALTTLTAINAVMAFESVGSILVIAMLIVPGATALIVSHNLKVILILSLIFAAMAALIGHLMAIWFVPYSFNFMLSGSHFSAVSSAGMMTVASGLLFVFCLIISRIRQNLPL
ncbi:MAG: metal ABC transporter permease [Verrucomicrobiota bacterium]